MFINTIINKKTVIRLYLVQQKIIPSQEEYIHAYSNNKNYIHSKIYVDKDRVFKHEDAVGIYRIHRCGWSKPDDYLLTYYKDRCIVKDGKVVGIKYYKADDKGERLGNMWNIQYGGGSYPTQKPYKLLERIILLSTK